MPKIAKTNNQNLYSLKKLVTELDEIELKLQHIRLLINYYRNPPERYETDWDTWEAKELK